MPHGFKSARESILWALKEGLEGPHTVEPSHEPLDQEGPGPVHGNHGDPIKTSVFRSEQTDGEGQRGSAGACHLKWPQQRLKSQPPSEGGTDPP